MALTTRGQKFFTATTTQTSTSTLIFWLSLSLTISAVYAFLAIPQAFSAEYVIQDDARQHIFWMQRFLDAQLFPNDLIADYFQSVAPAGYNALYQIMAILGISPIFLHKLLPMFLGLITTVYGFNVCLQLFPVPLAGFLTTLLLNQSLWMQDGLISATPKAFIYPLFLAWLYYSIRQQIRGTCVALILLGLFYPQGVLIAAGISVLRLVKWEKLPYFSVKDSIAPKLKPISSMFPLGKRDGRESKIKFHLSANWSDYRFNGICLAVAFFILLPYALSASDFGPTIARSQAQVLPEFLPKGRSQFFIADTWQFWFHGRSGIGLATILTPAFMAFGFLLPGLQKFPHRFPLSQEIKNSVVVLPQLVVASFGLFLAAHALLFRLHLPSRYTQHTLRMVLAISAAIALTLIIDTLWSQAIQSWRKLLLFPVMATLFTGLIFYPQLAMSKFPWTYYQVGQQPKLYQFFQQQPKDSLIASLSEEASNLPSFAQRSILTAREYAVPYHWGYYAQFRQRTLDLIQSQYSPNLADVQELIKKYQIDFLLVERGAFTPGYLAPNTWLNQYQVTQEAIARLSADRLPAIANYLDRCSVFESNGLIVLNAQCLSNIPGD